MDKNMKVKIINYQRIKKASLEFVPGLNAIIGQTNNGKSSIIRAIETAIYNISREGHVTLGETKSAVGIEYNGHQVIWRRDTDASSQVTYRVDGKIYGKLGKGQPEIVKEALGISEVEINDTKFRVNFSKQMAYPFLLDATPSELFKFIVQSSEEDNVVEVLNTMRSDVNEIASNVKMYDEARNSLGIAYQREATKYKEKKPYLEYCDEVLMLENKIKSYKKLKEAIESYEKCRYVVMKSEEAISNLTKIQEQMANTEQILVDGISKVEKLTSLLRSFDTVKNELGIIDNEITHNREALEALSDVELYVELYQNMEPKQMNLKVLKAKTDEYREKLDNYNSDISEIARITEDLEKKEKVYAAVERALAKVDSNKNSVRDLKASMGEYQSTKLDYREMVENEESCRTIISDVETEISNIGVCPYCGSELKGGDHEHS